MNQWRSLPEPVLYLEALFGPILAADFGLQLLEPPLDWLPRLPMEYRQREVVLTTLAECWERREPTFIKPPNDKSFPAKVYTGAQLPREYPDTPVLAAEIVSWEKEFRAFILDRQVRTISIYLRDGELQLDRDFTATDEELAAATAFINKVLADTRVDLPRTAVLDVGVIRDRGWAVVEQNSAWGAGIYGCDPIRVLEVLRHAAVPIDR